MKTRKWLCLAGAAGLALALAAPAWAQRGDRGDREGRGYGGERGEGRGYGGDRGDRGGRGGRRFDPTDFLKRMDANGNGILEPEEAQGRARGFVDRIAEQAGLDPKQPLSIEKLSAAAQSRSEGGERKEGEEETKTETTTTPMPAAGTSSTTTPTTPTTPATTPESPKSDSKPLVPGFGVATNRTLPPGFGTPLPGASDSSSSGRSSRYGSSRSSGSSSSGSSSSRGGDPREAAQKVRRYAESLLKQYDENKNGVLERDEWSKMRGDPEKADTNGDKIVTADELADRLASYSTDGGSSSSSSSNSSSSSSRGDRERGDRERGSRGGDRERGDRSRSRGNDDDDDERKSYRFLTPTERLPKGLPTWFTRNDADADGQVSMAEYSTVYNETTVAEFLKFDLDGNGIITPEECLEVEADKTKSAKKY